MPPQINESNFDELVKGENGVVLVDFWAPWCGPCRILGPIIEEVAQQADGVTVSKINVDENPALAEQYGVRSIPTVIIFKNGNPVEQVVGVRSKEDYLKLIQNHQG